MNFKDLTGSKGKPCPVCLTTTESEPEFLEEDLFDVKCIRCGHFKISPILFSGTAEQRDHFIADITDEKRHIVSSWIRERTKEEEPIVINETAFYEATNASDLDIFDKAQRIMLAVRKLHPKIGEVFFSSLSDIVVDGNSNSPIDREINNILGQCWLIDVNELVYIVKRYLTGEVGYLEKRKPLTMAERVSYFFTPKGWNYFNQLERNKESQQGFIAMSFDEKHNHLHNVIWKGIEKAGWEAFSLKLPHNNNITDELISAIKRARFIVADFTDNKQNVYYEAGFARGYGLPIVHLINKKQIKKLHFDTAQNLHISWTDQELESGELTKKLSKHITATIGFGPKYKES